MNNSIFQDALRNVTIKFNDPRFEAINAVNEKNRFLTHRLNNEYHDHRGVNTLISAIIGQPVDDSNSFNPPFNTDFGHHIFLGKNIFINQGCMFVDLGGIYIGDGVLLGPGASIVTVNHIEAPGHRRDIQCASVHIKNGVWIGVNATILPGISIGENAIVGAGALVTKDVPAETVVVGTPAHVIRKIRSRDMP